MPHYFELKNNFSWICPSIIVINSPFFKLHPSKKAVLNCIYPLVCLNIAAVYGYLDEYIRWQFFKWEGITEQSPLLFLFDALSRQDHIVWHFLIRCCCKLLILKRKAALSYTVYFVGVFYSFWSVYAWSKGNFFVWCKCLIHCRFINGAMG